MHIRTGRRHKLLSPLHHTLDGGTSSPPLCTTAQGGGTWSPPLCTIAQDGGTGSQRLCTTAHGGGSRIPTRLRHSTGARERFPTLAHILARRRDRFQVYQVSPSFQSTYITMEHIHGSNHNLPQSEKRAPQGRRGLELLTIGATPRIPGGSTCNQTVENIHGSDHNHPHTQDRATQGRRGLEPLTGCMPYDVFWHGVWVWGSARSVILPLTT